MDIAVIAANLQRGPEQTEVLVNPKGPLPERSDVPARAGNTVSGQPGDLWELVFSRENLLTALRRVEANAGAPGADGLRTDQLRSWCLGHWAGIREELDAGMYRPQPVKVNREKSRISPAGVATLLGYGFFYTVTGVKQRVAPKSLKAEVPETGQGADQAAHIPEVEYLDG